MPKKRRYLLLFLLCFSLLASLLPQVTLAESEEKTEVTYPLEITDTADRKVTLEKQPRKLVSLGPNMTELVFALGAGDLLVGRTDYCDYPEEALDIASIGTLMEPNLELIAELEPDLVLASTHVPDEVIAKLTELNIPTLMLYDEEHLAGLQDIIDKLGEALNLTQAAADLKKEVFDRIADVQARADKLPEEFTVYYVVGYGESGEYTAGGNTFINDIIEAAGGVNVAAELEGWSYSLEELVAAEPDLIIIPTWADGDFQTTEPYDQLSEHIVVVDDNLFSRQGPRNAEAVEQLYYELFCISNEELVETEYPLTYSDNLEREVEIPAEPKKVISLGPNMTELVFALTEDADKLLVGRTDYCDYPEKVQNIDSIGTLMEPNLELIAEKEPDLVLASTHISDEVLDKLDELHIPVVMLYDEEHLSGLSDIILDLGELLNLQNSARLLELNCSRRMEIASRKVQKYESPEIYYLVGYGESGEYTAGGNTFINDIIEAGGAKNAAADLDGWSYSLEQLMETDPDIILLPTWAAADFGQEEPYSELTAVKEDRLIVVDENIFARQGNRNAEAVELVAKLVEDLADGVLDEDYSLETEETEETEVEETSGKAA